jgi:predicted membrane protein
MHSNVTLFTLCTHFMTNEFWFWAGIISAAFSIISLIFAMINIFLNIKRRRQCRYRANLESQDNQVQPDVTDFAAEHDCVNNTPFINTYNLPVFKQVRSYFHMGTQTDGSSASLNSACSEPPHITTPFTYKRRGHIKRL